MCKFYGVEEAEVAAAGKGRMASEVREMMAWLVVESGKLTLSELSRHLKRDISTLSSAVRHLLLRAKEDVKLGRKMVRLREVVL